MWKTINKLTIQKDNLGGKKKRSFQYFFFLNFLLFLINQRKSICWVVTRRCKDCRKNGGLNILPPRENGRVMLYKIKYSVQQRHENQSWTKLYFFLICDGTQTLNISWNLAITEGDKNIALIRITHPRFKSQISDQYFIRLRADISIV